MRNGIKEPAEHVGRWARDRFDLQCVERRDQRRDKDEDEHQRADDPRNFYRLVEPHALTGLVSAGGGKEIRHEPA